MKVHVVAYIIRKIAYLLLTFFALLGVSRTQKSRMIWKLSHIATFRAKKEKEVVLPVRPRRSLLSDEDMLRFLGESMQEEAAKRNGNLFEPIKCGDLCHQEKLKL